jgi:hypothetical protein
LYVAGALTKVSEVSGAGFSASTVLSDIPIQQLLALGISSLASPVAIEAAAVAMAIAALWGLALEYFMRESSPVPRHAAAEPETAPDPASGPQNVNSWIAGLPWLLKVVIGVPLGLFVLWLFIVSVLNLRLDTAANVACFFVVVVLARRHGYRWRMAIPVAYVSGVIVGITVFALVWPSPLPEAVVTTRNGATTGQLLATTDAAVVIGLGNCRIVTIPTVSVVRLVVITRTHRLVGNLGTTLFGPAVPQEKPPMKLVGPCGT